MITGRLPQALALAAMCLLFGFAAMAETVPAATEHLNQARLADLRQVRKGVPSGSREAAIMDYHIAELSHDYDAMGKVVDALERLGTIHPKDAEIRAYLGSALTLRARDYPWQGLYQLIPGPGFVRMGYTGRGIDVLQEAVELAPKHPVVRLVRGITLTKMPRPFMQFGTGLNDLELLAKWMEHPSSNPAFAGILKDPAFRADVYFRLAEAYASDGEDEKSRAAYAKAADEAPAGSPVAQAARELARSR